MKLLSVFEIWKWDGGDRHYPSGICFADKQTAIAFADNKNHDIVRDHIFTVYDSIEDYCENNPEALKKRALAKLTPEEKQALGY